MPIVVATDFSEHAHSAVAAAAAIARRLGTSLKLVHVSEEPSSRRVDDGEHKRRQVAYHDRLETESARIRKEGLTVEPELLEGLPDEAVVAFAVKSKAQLVVAAALGTRRTSRWTLGSVADRIAQSASCPVLIIRNAEPFRAWARNERALRIVLADDFSRFSKAALVWIANLSRVGPIELSALHATSLFSAYGRLGLPHEGEGQAEVESVLNRELQERLESVGVLRSNTRVVFTEGRIPGPLVGAASEERADLLVLGTHHRKGFSRLWHDSVSHAALSLAPMSVATVPLPAPGELVPQVVPPVRKVLVTTDFSPVGDLAVPHAYSLLPNGGEVILLHVIQTAIPLVYGEHSPAAAILTAPGEGLVAEDKKKLEVLIPAASKLHGIKTQIEVVTALNVATAILQASERLGADVVCIASHGHSGMTRVLLGSVAHAVIARSRRPVLIVRSSPTE